jgi:hypothetical protein
VSPLAVVSPGVGTWLRHDGETWQVLSLDGVGVLLKDPRGRQRQVLLEHLLTHPSTSPVLSDDHGAERAIGPVLDAVGPLEELEERAAHIREVLTGYRSGSAERALPGKPRPQYVAGQSLMARYQAKGAEIGVEERTLRRWAADFGALGEVGLVDRRRDRRSAGRPGRLLVWGWPGPLGWDCRWWSLGAGVTG